MGRPAVCAQSGTSPQTRAKINLVAWGEDITGLRLGKDSKEVTALAFRYGSTVRYSGPRLLEISRADHPDPPPAPRQDEGHGENSPKVRDKEMDAPVRGKVPAPILKRREKNPELVALAALPEGSRYVTILLAPGPGGTFTSYVIDDDPRQFPPGRLRVHNFSKQLIAMSCNKSKPRTVKPGGSFTLAPKKETVLYQLAYQQGGKWKMYERNILSVPPGEQVQFFILQSEASFFVSGQGSRTGFLQTVDLRRSPRQEAGEKEG